MRDTTTTPPTSASPVSGRLNSVLPPPGQSRLAFSPACPKPPKVSFAAVHSKLPKFSLATTAHASGFTKLHGCRLSARQARRALPTDTAPFAPNSQAVQGHTRPTSSDLARALLTPRFDDDNPDAYGNSSSKAFVFARYSRF